VKHPPRHQHHHDPEDFAPQGETSPEGDERPRRRGRHPRGGPGRFGPPDFGPGYPGGPLGFGPPGPFGPPAPGPRGMRPGGRRRRRGAVRLAILSLLAEQPSNGYGLIQAIAARTNDTWTPSPGSVYPTLQQLVDEGLIEPTGTQRSSDFRLTEQGAAYVAEHADELRTAWQQAEDDTVGLGALHTALGQLMGVVGQFRFAASQDQRARAVDLLDDTRRALYRILAE